MAVSYYSRWQEAAIRHALKHRRILLLAGSRQCGKTTLAKRLSNDDTVYYTLDDVTLLNAAREDPQGFIHHPHCLMIIDEVQRAPELLLSIKQEVDENQAPGRFLLTGSANISSLPSVSESLAGRITKIRLRPLARGEILGNKPHFIQRAFQGDFSSMSDAPHEQKPDYIAHAFSGGYPEPLRLQDASDKRKWYKDYLDALLERDLVDIAQVRRKNSLRKLVNVLAAWSSKFLTLSDISRDLSTARLTIETYINALESLYLVERVSPWHKTDYDRVGKQDKFFMTDTGLMASILNWRLEEVMMDGDKNGKLLETFVFNQLSAMIDAETECYELFHYRDGEKREIDFIIENEKGEILGIEVKAGSAVTPAAFKHMNWFASHIAGKRPFKSIILYSGKHIVSFGANRWAVPINALWA